MVDWLQDHLRLICWSFGCSLVLLIGAGIAAVCVPADYFMEGQGSRSSSGSWRVLRNMFGWLLVLTGVVMIVLPGPGVLVILLGVTLTDLPGKHRLVVWLLSRGPVLGPVNKLRKIFGREAFRLPGNTNAVSAHQSSRRQLMDWPA